MRGTYPAARKLLLDDLSALGIDYFDVVQLLEDEGVEKFEAAWSELTTSLRGELDGR